MASTRLTLPVSNTPEPDPNDSSEPRFSVAHSRVVLQSLKQSRERWLSAFQKFSSRSRSKNPGVVPAPHTSKRHGTCDIYIGPHVFYNTSIFEIHYTTPLVYTTAYRPPSQYNHAQPSWNAMSSYSYQYTSPSSEPAGNPLVTITPELLSRVTRAGASNPTLANLLQLAASGYASQEQLRTLGLLIQSLAASPDEDYPSSSSSPYSTVPSSRPHTGYSGPAPASSLSTKPPELVLEFPEKLSVQFILPRGPAYCERVPSSTQISRHDILLTTALHIADSADSASRSSESEPKNPSTPSQVVSFRFANASAPLWEFTQTWAGGPSAIETNRKILGDQRIKQPPRVYLQHRLPEGPLLSQIHNAAPLFTTRLIKPARGATNAKRKRSKPSTLRKQPTNEAVGSTASQVPTKRKKASAQTEQHGFVMDLGAPVKILCQRCGQADVLLLKDGQFCRSCVAASETIAPSNTVNHNPPDLSQPAHGA